MTARPQHHVGAEGDVFAVPLEDPEANGGASTWAFGLVARRRGGSILVYLFQPAVPVVPADPPRLSVADVIDVAITGVTYLESGR